MRTEVILNLALVRPGWEELVAELIQEVEAFVIDRPLLDPVEVVVGWLRGGSYDATLPVEGIEVTLSLSRDGQEWAWHAVMYWTDLRHGDRRQILQAKLTDAARRLVDVRWSDVRGKKVGNG